MHRSFNDIRPPHRFTRPELGRRSSRRRTALATATAGALVALASPGVAMAAEFVTDPEASIGTTCVAGPHASVAMTNTDGNMSAWFDIHLDGEVAIQGIEVSPVGHGVTQFVPLVEDQAHVVDVYADGVLVASGPVSADCHTPPPVWTEPDASIAMTCTEDGPLLTWTLQSANYDVSFDLVPPSSSAIDWSRTPALPDWWSIVLPADAPDLTAEVWLVEDAAWTAKVGISSGWWPEASGVADCEAASSISIPAPEIPTPSIPEPSVPADEPEPTVASSTVPQPLEQSQAQPQPAPAPEAPAPAAPAAVPAAPSLPSTGTSSVVMAALATALVGAGLTATRLARR